MLVVKNNWSKFNDFNKNLHTITSYHHILFYFKHSSWYIEKKHKKKSHSIYTMQENTSIVPVILPKVKLICIHKAIHV